VTQNTIKRTIMYRNTYDGGDGWVYYPLTVEIADTCPECGGKRGEAVPYRFCEDGDWFTVDKWENPCGHLDLYKDVYHESKRLKAA